MSLGRKPKKYLKYFFETSRTIVFKEYYFFYKPEDASTSLDNSYAAPADAFPEELLYFLFLSKKVVILRKNNELRPFGFRPRAGKYGIKNLRIVENENEFK